MSWKEAVEEVIDQMTEDAERSKEYEDARAADYLMNVIKSATRSLRAVCKSVGNLPLSPPMPTSIGAFPFNAGGMSADLQNYMGIENARSEFRKQPKNAASIEEVHDGEGVMCVGGPADGSLYTVHPNMPLGSLIETSGAMYQLHLNTELQVKQLVLHEKKTEELQLMLLAKKSGD